MNYEDDLNRTIFQYGQMRLYFLLFAGILAGPLEVLSEANSDVSEKVTRLVHDEEAGHEKTFVRGAAILQIDLTEKDRYNTEQVSRYTPSTLEDFTDLYVADGFAYLGNSYDGVRVIDISDPRNLQEVGIFPRPNSFISKFEMGSGQVNQVASGEHVEFPAGIALDSNEIFVAEYGRAPVAAFYTISAAERDGAVLAIDRETGDIRTVVSGGDLTHPLGIAVGRTGKLYVTNFQSERNGVFEVNASTGSLIPLLNQSAVAFPFGVATDLESGAIYVSDGGDFVNRRPSALLRFDPETEVWTTVIAGPAGGATDPFYSLRDIAIDADGSVIALDAGIETFNIPPRLIRIDPITRSVTTLHAGDPLRTPVRLALGENGIVYISDLHANPRNVGITTGAIFRFERTTQAFFTLLTGEDAPAPYGLALDQNGVLIWSNITKRTRIADIKVSGGVALVTNEVFNSVPILTAGLRGIQILDVSDPSNPTELAKFTDNLAIRGVHNTFISGDFAYLVSNAGGIRILDISNPSEPVEVGFWEISATEQPVGWTIIPHDVTVAGDRAYIAYAQAGLRILDVSDPRSPTQIGVYKYAGGWTHSAEPSEDGKLVFTTDEQTGGFMRVIDISDLTQIRQIGFYKSSNRVVYNGRQLSIHNIHVSDDLVYVGNYQDGFRAVDIADPTEPVEVGAYVLQSQYTEGFYNGAWSAFPYGELVYVSDLEHGLFVLRFRRPLAVLRGESSPFDYDGDGQVGFSDFLFFAQAFDSRVGDDRYGIRFDMDENGWVNFADFLAFVKVFGK